jgi:beta-galactosidase
MDFIECNEYYESWSEGTPEDLRNNLKAIHRAFPDKPILISEYGYCSCVPERPEGDARRTEVLLDHTRVCRELDFIAGASRRKPAALEISDRLALPSHAHYD